jgi:hypothetical protein
MKLPDFLVVGTARAGTTALHHYLRQHPGLFLPRQKEPCFFCFYDERINYKNGKFYFAVTKEEEYMRLFRDAGRRQKTGEISTPYLYLHHQTIKNIRRFYVPPRLPSIVIVLRNPVERAYSQYLWKVRDGREKLSFDEALKNEPRRKKENFSFDYLYAERGLYFEAVRNYLENFPSVKILRHEDFRMSFRDTLSQLCEFLGVDPEFPFERKEKYNSSEAPRFAALGRIMTVENRFKFKMLGYLPDSLRAGIREQFIRWNASGNPPPPMSEEARSYLQRYYREDLRKLQALTGIDFSLWVKQE